jgi:large subunit ribosomal protein L6
VILPRGVKVTADAERILVDGPKGKLSQPLVKGVQVQVEGSTVTVSRENDNRSSRANQGLIRALLANMVQGVDKGFERVLEISGVGYRAEMSGKQLTLLLGYSHPVVYIIPDDIDVSVEKNTRVIVRGIDRQRVGQMAAKIRSTKIPDPYKIKGILYEGERIKKKAGKKAVT